MPSKSPTTTPLVETVPVIAAAAPEPWIAEIGVYVLQMSTAVKPTTKSTVRLSGGSLPS